MDSKKTYTKIIEDAITEWAKHEFIETTQAPSLAAFIYDKLKPTLGPKYRLVNMHDGLGNRGSDEKFFKPHLYKTFQIKRNFGRGFVLTDIEVPGEADCDYVRDGYLIVSRMQYEPAGLIE